MSVYRAGHAYVPAAVVDGKQVYREIWGCVPNVDDWKRRLAFIAKVHTLLVPLDRAK